jgi:ABC-type antimicrobial peptide transport system permease subunit
LITSLTLIGAALGLPLGLFLAALATRGLSSSGVGFHLPIRSLLIFTAIAIAAGVLAARQWDRATVEGREPAPVAGLSPH